MIYLDNSATTKTTDSVARAVADSMENCWFNPSAVYGEGLMSEKLLDRVRSSILKSLNGSNADVIFTCGGTDGDCLALTGVANGARDIKKHIITSNVEHPAILKTCEFLASKGYDITVIPVDITGRVSPEAVADAVRDDTLLVSIMHVNNETGSVNDIKAISRAVKARNPETLMHTDAVQAYLRVDADLSDWGVDLYTLSGHKIHAPKGSGALYVRHGIAISGVQTGGGQEFGMRSGTQNVPAIAGLGQAVSDWNAEQNDYIRNIKNRLLANVTALVDDFIVNGALEEYSAPHILNLGFKGVRAETLLHALEERHVLVATGSACSSKKRKISEVLDKMGVPIDYAEGAIRISLGALNTPEEADIASEEIAGCVKMLRKFKRR